MGFKSIQLQIDSRIARLALLRPPLNVIDLSMMEEMDRAWTVIEESEANLVVLSGKSDNAFSAGVDIADHTVERVQGMLQCFHKVIRRIYSSDLISIAAIHGHTLGGGAELALASDFVIAADDLQFGFPEIEVGCYPPVAATLLPQIVGIHRASQFLLLGDIISAKKAKELGLVNLVVPRNEFETSVSEWLDLLLQKSAAVMAIAKKALHEENSFNFDRRLKLIEDLYLDKLTNTADMKEGIEAFMEKRIPDWTHR